MSLRCPLCGRDYPDDARYCLADGQPLPVPSASPPAPVPNRNRTLTGTGTEAALGDEPATIRMPSPSDAPDERRPHTLPMGTLTGMVPPQEVRDAASQPPPAAVREPEPARRAAPPAPAPAPRAPPPPAQPAPAQPAQPAQPAPRAPAPPAPPAQPAPSPAPQPAPRAPSPAPRPVVAMPMQPPVAPQPPPQSPPPPPQSAPPRAPSPRAPSSSPRGCWIALVALAGLATVAVVAFEVLVLALLDAALPSPPTRFALALLVAGALLGPALGVATATAASRLRRDDHPRDDDDDATRVHRAVVAERTPRAG